MTVLSESNHRARKYHYCDGYYWLDEDAHNISKETGEEIYICKGIAAGDIYNRQVGVYFEPGFCVFKCCIPCLEFAKKHKLKFYEEY